MQEIGQAVMQVDRKSLETKRCCTGICRKEGTRTFGLEYPLVDVFMLFKEIKELCLQKNLQTMQSLVHHYDIKPVLNIISEKIHNT